MERLETKGIGAPAAPEGTGGASGAAAAATVEVVAKARRRRFSAEYKARMLREADACAGTGQLGLCCGARGCTPRT